MPQQSDFRRIDAFLRQDRVEHHWHVCPQERPRV
jgi:hypothetical protein